MRAFIAAGAMVALGLGMWGCSGNGYTSGNSGNPTTPTISTPGVVRINVVAVNGAQSFSPNPANLPASVNQDTSSTSLPCQGAYCD